MHIHRSQGHGSRCLVKAQENVFEYKQRSLLETIATYKVTWGNSVNWVTL